MKSVVIIGGGFGGVYTAKYLLRKLKNKKDVTIILINKTNFFLFTPMLHEVATGGLNKHDIIEPVREVLKADNFKFIQETVEEIDFNNKRVICSACKFKFDYLVIAVGSTTNFCDIPRAKEYCLDLKDIKTAAEVRNRIIDSIETASKDYKSKDISKYLNFIVVGGGPTGVELAAEISEFINQMLNNSYECLGKKNHKVYLVQKGDKIIPSAHPKCIEEAAKELIRKEVILLTNSTVTKVFEDGIKINNKKKIYSNTVVWTAGIKPRAIKTTPRLSNGSGYFQVNKYLQIKGLKEVFAIGDCALFFNKGENKPVNASAQTAVIQARYAAENIINLIESRGLKECKVRSNGLLVSIGKKYAIADIKGIRFKGFFAWWLWRTIYLFKLIGWTNKIRVAINWTINLFSKRDTSRI